MTSTKSVRVQDFKRIVFFTGAGVSAESGVPTFRGKGGMWEQYDYQSYACQDAFEKDPEKVWTFNNMRRSMVGACQPNEAHRIIARCEQDLDAEVTVVTQNIDGFHQIAGSQNVLELHGSLWRVRCDVCHNQHTSHEPSLEDLHCDRCGSWWRPDIVWFGDNLLQAVIEKSMRAIYACDLLVSIGTSAVVFPAAQMPLEARNVGATLIEINPEETRLSSFYDHCMRGPASKMLAELCVF